MDEHDGEGPEPAEEYDAEHDEARDDQEESEEDGRPLQDDTEEESDDNEAVDGLDAAVTKQQLLMLMVKSNFALKREQVKTNKMLAQLVGRDVQGRQQAAQPPLRRANAGIPNPGRRAARPTRSQRLSASVTG